MSCVLADREQRETLATVPERDGREHLLECLGNGLHAMVQPLTILRGALGVIALKGGVAGAPERYLEISNSQVDRLCSLMSGVQSLLDTLRFEANCAPMNLWERIRPVFDELNASLAERGVSLAIARPFENLQVTADATRTELAFEAALNAAAAISSPGDEIEIDAVSGGGFVELAIRNRNARGKNLSSDERLNLTLAEASILSQQGGYELAWDPFRVSFRLALHEPGRMDAGYMGALPLQSGFMKSCSETIRLS